MWQPLRRLTVAGAIVLLVLASQATAAGQTASSVYTVGPLTVPGVDTGLVLQKNRTVTVTATGSVCPGTGFCATPDGYPSIDTTTSVFGGFVLPGAPAYGLVAKVGTGPWMHVGSGPIKVSGTGDLVFAFNDDLFPDNVGSFVVTVSYARGSATQVSPPCQPGWGYGDANHEHTGPPGHSEDACYPGHGYGDKNHDHAGPPGRTSAGSSSTTRGKSH
jgi:hypothetical protein